MRHRWRCAVALLGLWGCSASNRNPELRSFNGVEPKSLVGILYFDEVFFFEPGETVDLEVDATDPDRDEIQIWFVYQPPGLCFDPDGTAGVWEVPESYEEDSTTFSLVLADDSDPTGITSVEISFVNRYRSQDTGKDWGWDTGWEAPVEP